MQPDTAQFHLGTGLRRAVEQAWEPCERDSERAPVDEVDPEAIFVEANRERFGEIAWNSVKKVMPDAFDEVTPLFYNSNELFLHVSGKTAIVGQRHFGP